MGGFHLCARLQYGVVHSFIIVFVWITRYTIIINHLLSFIKLTPRALITTTSLGIEPWHGQL